MDDRIEAFIREILRLKGCTQSAIHEGVRISLTNCEKLFRDSESKKTEKQKAADACRALCRARVREEMTQHRRTPATVDHLKLVLGVIDQARDMKKARLSRAKRVT